MKFFVAALLCLSAFSAFSLTDEEQAVFKRLSMQEGAGGPLFWSQADRRIMFRHMARVMPARQVKAGESAFPLVESPISLDAVTYTVDGETYPLSHYLNDPAQVGLIVVKDGKVLFERYSAGNDENSRWISFSVTKSVTAMLIGAAIQDGYIESVDEPVANYLPRLRGTGYEKATIKDVLNMASGLSWSEDYADPDSDVAKAGAFNGISLVKYLGTLPLEETPGEKFNYNTGETNLVGEILRAAIGNNAATYLSHKIWQPFGMGADAYWSLGEPGGGELGGCCINATLRDYARLGIFAMNGGQLPDGTSVLPDTWMAESTSPSKGYEGYGYLWWLMGDRGYAALGIFGQMIRIFPEDALVIAAHGNAKSAVGSVYHDHHRAAIEAIRDYLMSTGK